MLVGIAGESGSTDDNNFCIAAYFADLHTVPEVEVDFLPVVKLFTPDARCTSLLTAIDPDDTDIAFCVCDLGMGYPELGIVSLTELASVRGGLTRFLPGTAHRRLCRRGEAPWPDQCLKRPAVPSAAIRADALSDGQLRAIRVDCIDDG